MSFYDTAVELLDIFTDAFDARGALPGRRFVTNGAVAVNLCEEVLAVSKQATRFEIPGAESSIRGGGLTPLLSAGLGQFVTDYEIWILRCVPTVDDEGGQPSVTALKDSADELMQDAETLLTTVSSELANGAFLSTCTRVTFAQLEPYGPEGSLGGSFLRLSVVP